MIMVMTAATVFPVFVMMIMAAAFLIMFMMMVVFVTVAVFVMLVAMVMMSMTVMVLPATGVFLLLENLFRFAHSPSTPFHTASSTGFRPEI